MKKSYKVARVFCILLTVLSALLILFTYETWLPLFAGAFAGYGLSGEYAEGFLDLGGYVLGLIAGILGQIACKYYSDITASGKSAKAKKGPMAEELKDFGRFLFSNKVFDQAASENYNNTTSAKSIAMAKWMCLIGFICIIAASLVHISYCQSCTSPFTRFSGAMWVECVVLLLVSITFFIYSTRGSVHENEKQ